MSSASKAVGTMGDWVGGLRDLFKQIEDGMHPDDFYGWVAHRQVRRLRKGDTAEPVYKDHLARWEERFKRDLSALWIPEHQEGFDCLLVVPQGMRPNKACDRLKEAKMPAYRYTKNLNNIFSGRIACADYAVWMRDGQEADAEFRNMSADDCLARLVNGITLEEQLLFNEDWFLRHGTHLDEKSWTLCTGSRYSDGNVPCVSCCDGDVRVRWAEHGLAAPVMGVRQVVS